MSTGTTFNTHLFCIEHFFKNTFHGCYRPSIVVCFTCSFLPSAVVPHFQNPGSPSCFMCIHTNEETSLFVCCHLAWFVLTLPVIFFCRLLYGYRCSASVNRNSGVRKCCSACIASKFTIFFSLFNEVFRVFLVLRI